MIGALVTLSALCIPAGATPVAAADSARLAELYQAGIPFSTFLDRAVRRRATWLGNHAKGRVPDDLLARARAVPGRWRLLVVAVDGCSDSVNTIPYLAHLVDAVDGLEMRIVDPDRGRPVMEAHRTPDGRAATPTIVLLDPSYREVGWFVERPRALQAWVAEHKGQTSYPAFVARKFAWYDADLGRETIREIVELMEHAAGPDQGPARGF